MFTRGSRYESVAESDFTMRDGRTVRYKLIRFLPEGGGAPGYIVQQGDRPDLAAWRIAQDPEAFWRLCDANWTMRPAELTANVGQRILIPRANGGGPR
jgi:hypothetical protein